MKRVIKRTVGVSLGGVLEDGRINDGKPTATPESPELGLETIDTHLRGRRMLLVRGDQSTRAHIRRRVSGTV